jgi:hypothetical protein
MSIMQLDGVEFIQIDYFNEQAPSQYFPQPIDYQPITNKKKQY